MMPLILKTMQIGWRPGLCRSIALKIPAKPLKVYRTIVAVISPTSALVITLPSRLMISSTRSSPPPRGIWSLKVSLKNWSSGIQRRFITCKPISVQNR